MHQRKLRAEVNPALGAEVRSGKAAWDCSFPCKFVGISNHRFRNVELTTQENKFRTTFLAVPRQPCRVTLPEFKL